MFYGFAQVKNLVPAIFCMTLIAFPNLGCNSGGTDGRKAFSGSVSLDGTSVDGGSITFESVNSTTLFRSGAKILQGTFSVDAKNGLPPGEYLVKINWPHRPGNQEASNTKSSIPSSASQSKVDNPQLPEAFNRPASVERIPPKYNKKSELKVTIEETGKNQFTFDLQSSPG